MNERIRELAEQAGFEITPWRDELLPCVHQEGPIDIELEKFAELIVQECATVCQNIDKEYDGEDVLATWCATEIKKHFGVE